MQFLIRTLLTLIVISTNVLTRSPIPTVEAEPIGNQTSGGLLLLRVRVSTPTDVSRLLASGVDVLEAGGLNRTELLVLGDDAVLTHLRALSFQVTIDQRNTRPANAPFTYFGGYRTVAEHEQHLADVVAAYPTLAKVISYGVSWRKQQGLTDGHDLQAICLTKLRENNIDCALSPETDKPRFFLMAAIHARELSTSEMAWRWIDWLVQAYGRDAEVTALLDHSEMWVVPIANPDGRERVEQGGDAPYLQRKNLHTVYPAPTPSPCTQPPSSSLLFNQDGVDLNRNANFKWGNAGTTFCEPTYQGEAAASEPEEQALEQLMGQLFRDQRGDSDVASAPITATGAMLTLHSYSDLVLVPWGWTECGGSPCNPALQAPNNSGLRAFAFRMNYFNGYTAGQASELLYAASGTTDDWAYGRLGIAAATFEIGPISDGSACSERQSFTAFTPAYACQDARFWPLNRPAFLMAAKLARQPYALAHGPVVISSSLSFASNLAASGDLSVTLVTRVNDNAFGNSGVSRPASQPISAAELYLDGPPWASGNHTPIRFSPVDGAFDSADEQLSASLVISASTFMANKQLAYIRAQDTTGAWGPVSAVWLNDLRPMYLPLVYK